MAAHTLTETIYGVDKKPRSLQQWEEISHSSTQKVTQMGSQVPMAWVLVRGKNIPPNAIVAGEDKRRPLYIARTFWEVSEFPVLDTFSVLTLSMSRVEFVSWHPSVVDPSLTDESSLSRHRASRVAPRQGCFVCEVLVPLQQTIKYEIAENYNISTIPRISRSASDEALLDPSVAQLLQKLRAIKIVMVVDDSISMVGTLWSQARSALIGLVSVIESDYGTNGIDLCFMNNPTFESNIRDRHRIQNIFDCVDPQGSTPTGAKLQELFNKYLPLVEDPAKNSPAIVIMVITDGVPTDNVENIIADAARRLDQNHIPLHRFGVSFVQIGNDPDAAEFLQELDDDISKRFSCRDMVDTTPYNPDRPELTREVFFKCVLGSVDAYYDQPPNPLNGMPHPQFGNNHYQPVASPSPITPAFPRPLSMPLAN